MKNRVARDDRAREARDQIVLRGTSNTLIYLLFICGIKLVWLRMGLIFLFMA